LISSASTTFANSGPGAESEAACARHRVELQELGAGDVARHQVGRELDAIEREIERACQSSRSSTSSPDRELRRAGSVPASDREQELIDHLVLARRSRDATRFFIWAWTVRRRSRDASEHGVSFQMTAPCARSSRRRAGVRGGQALGDELCIGLSPNLGPDIHLIVGRATRQELSVLLGRFAAATARAARAPRLEHKPYRSMVQRDPEFNRR